MNFFASFLYDGVNRNIPVGLFSSQDQYISYRSVHDGIDQLAATGDSLISRRLPANDQAYREVASIIQQADVRFTNLETTVR